MFCAGSTLEYSLCIYFHSSRSRASIFAVTVYVLTCWPACGTHATFQVPLVHGGLSAALVLQGSGASNVALYSVVNHYHIHTGRVY